MSVIILLIAVSVFEGGRTLIVPVFFLGTMVAVLRTLDMPRLRFRGMLVLAAVAFLFHVVAIIGDHTEWGPPSGKWYTVSGMSAYTVFLLLAIMALVRRIFSERVVTFETIKGGISVYLLMGLLWAFLYTIFYVINPESLSISPPDATIADLVYYSFVTLTTLGYGDILPTAWHTRNLAFMEAVIGQIYMTVLIARLVGLHLANPKDA
jgi:hypothetical protein